MDLSPYFKNSVNFNAVSEQHLRPWKLLSCPDSVCQLMFQKLFHTLILICAVMVPCMYGYLCSLSKGGDTYQKVGGLTTIVKSFVHVGQNTDNAILVNLAGY